MVAFLGLVLCFILGYSKENFAGEAPFLEVYPTEIDFNAHSGISFMVKNSGNGTLNWSAIENPDTSWMWMNPPTSGSLRQGEVKYVQVEINTSGLSPGYYEGHINVNSNGGNKTLLVYFTLPFTYPEIRITQPKDGEVVSGIVTIKTYGWNAYSKALDKIEYYIDGSLRHTDDNPNPDTYLSSWNWDTSGYSGYIDGSHIIKVKGYDYDGASDEYQINVTIINAWPLIDYRISPINARVGEIVEAIFELRNSVPDSTYTIDSYLDISFPDYDYELGDSIEIYSKGDFQQAHIFHQGEVIYRRDGTTTHAIYPLVSAWDENVPWPANTTKSITLRFTSKHEGDFAINFRGSRGFLETGAFNRNPREGPITDDQQGWFVYQTKVHFDPAQPNLTPYKPDGWSDKIVVSKTQGTNTDDTPLYTTDNLYVDFAVVNNGSASITTSFNTSLYLDDKEDPVTTLLFIGNELKPGYYTSASDRDLGKLSSGPHTLKVVVDTTGVISESDESVADNAYIKTINISSPITGDLAGYVYDSLIDYIPVVDANVSIKNDSTTSDAKTGENGSFTFNDIPAGDYSFIVTAGTYDIDFYDTYSDSVTVVGNATTTKTVKLNRKQIAVTGEIIDFCSGQGINSAKLEFKGQSGEGNYTTYTNSSGTYSLNLYAGEYNIIISHPDYYSFNYYDYFDFYEIFNASNKTFDFDLYSKDCDENGFPDNEEKQVGSEPVNSYLNYLLKYYFSELGINVPIDPKRADPVNTRNGALYFQEQDFFIKGRGGLNIEFTRTYNSKEEINGRLGYGWNFSYNAYYYKYEDQGQTKVQIVFGDGTREDFTYNGSTYEPADFVYDTLTWNGSYFELKTPQGLVYRFNQKISDNMGMLSEMEDSNGNRIHLTYDNSSDGSFYLLTSVKDDLNRGLTLTYENDKIKTISDHTGRYKKFSYDAIGHLTDTEEYCSYQGIQEEPPLTESFTYDPNTHRMSSYTDERGSALENEYDSEGRVTKQKDNGKKVYELVYDPYDQNKGYKQTTVTSYRSDSDTDNVVEFDRFDDKERLIESGKIIEGIEKEITKYTWNGDTLQSITDANGHATTYEYNGRRKSKETLPDIQDEQNNTIHTEISYTYDPNLDFDRVQSKTVTVTKNGQPYSSQTTQFGYYYPNGNLKTTTDSLNNVSNYGYDDFGNITSIIDANNHEKKFYYDGNRLNLTKEEIQVITPQTQTLFTEYTYNSWDNIATKKDAEGNTTYFKYDSHNNLREIKDPKENYIKYTYDAEDHQTSITNQNGNVTKFEYNTDIQATLKQIEKVIPGKDSIYEKFSYDQIGNKISYLNGSIYETKYSYDAANRLVKVSDALNNITEFGYDAMGNKIWEEDAKDNRTNFEYNSRNQLKKIIYLEEQGSIEYQYDGFGNKLSQTDQRGNTIKFQYDGLNRLIAQSYTVSGNPYTMNIAYDNVGNKIGEIDYNTNKNSYGYSNYYIYDEANRLIKTTNAKDKVTTIFYDAVGNKTRVIDRADPDGVTNADHITQFTYDELNRLTQVINANGNAQVTYEYDAVGNKKKETDANEKITQFNYDPLNRLIEIIDASGNKTTSVYDEVNNLKTVTDALGHTTTYTYDALNRLESTSDALGNTTLYKYDAVGNLTTKTDANENTTTSTYDSLNRLIGVKDAAAIDDINIASYSYDKAGNLISITVDAKTSTFGYDEANRQVSADFPETEPFSFTYDANGNLIKQVDGKGQAIEFAYDKSNRLTNKIYPDGKTITFTYDNWDNPTEIQDLAGTFNYTYSLLNYPETETRQFAEVDSLYTITRDFDDMGNIVKITYPDSKNIEYVYDKLNRIDKLSYNTKDLVKYDYDNVGNLTEKGFLNGIIQTHSYNEINQLTSINITVQKNNQPLFSHDYTYDAVGNRTSLTKHTGNALTYNYDSLDRLTKVFYNSDIPTLKYAYDNLGNRTSFGGPFHQFSYTYKSASNKLTKITIDNNGEIIYAYDANGSVTEELYAQLNKEFLRVNSTYDYDNQIKETTYTYQPRLPELTAPTNSVQYLYDYQGNRVKKTTPEGLTYYLNSGNNVLCEIDAEGNIIKDLVYGLGLVASIEPADTIKYFHQDALGSTVLITDTEGKVIQEYDYGPFGEIENAQGLEDNKYLFTAQEFDSETNLYYYNSRYYQYLHGRFLTRDTGRRDLFNPQTLNPYIYVLNNPLRWVDPSGRDKERYIKKSLKQALYANFLGKYAYDAYYSEDDTTGLAILLQIGAGVFDLDIMGDVFSFIHDLENYHGKEWTGEQTDKIVLDLIAFAPLIGAVKYLKYLDESAALLKKEKQSKITEYLDEGLEGNKQVSKNLDSVDFQKQNRPPVNNIKWDEKRERWTDGKYVYYTHPDPNDIHGRGGTHYDRGDIETGKQEWSPNGINWYKK